MCQYAAEHGATEAVIKVEPENSASARVALRAGFAFVRRICEQDGTVFDRYERVLRAKMHADEVDIDRIWCGVCCVHNSHSGRIYPLHRCARRARTTQCTG